MFNHLQDLLAEIQERNQSEEILPHEEEFIEQIHYLSSWEKIFLEKRLYSLEWQVGSPHLFAILQKEGIFNICLFITSSNISNDDNILILNDLLEVEHSLLAEVILGAAAEIPQSEKVVCLLERCCDSALRDLLNDPQLKIPNYLEHLEGLLRDKEDLQHFRNLHLEVLISMEHSKVLEALKKQKIWAGEDVFEANKSLKELMGYVTKPQRESLDALLGQMTKTNFSGWKYSLGILRFILKTASMDDQLHVKKYVEGLFWKACISRNEQQFQICVLLAREMCYARAEEKKSTYLTWYKATVSEMSYKIQPEDFRTILTFLTDLIRVEEDPDFLDVHITSAVPAPPRCNEIVHEFKQISRIRRNELNPGIVQDEAGVLILDP
ncbi:uncharacterized protein LOC129792955 [Lutzomyia longipalpis]|uniref:uncharacterized protein LOC129792955 n=1 Tax=Lutzomyia longipalpis TaxID=7200 RepID=UPI0024840AD2|nr:uncharacterized protein LOC129792955 [Lutzomyia longipalpis]